MQKSSKHTFLTGMQLSIPILFGYLPIGFTFGILAVHAGLSPLEVGFMSLCVYAGASQLIAMGLLAAGASIPSIILTTFVVNLRHALMSASLVPFLKGWTKPQQAFFCMGLTDETYALNMNRFMHHGVFFPEVAGTNIFAHAIWVAGSIGGALLGDVIGDTQKIGMDFALGSMFIALLIPHIATSRKVLAVISGACLSLLFFLLGIGQWSILLATLFGSAIAAFSPLPATAEKK